MTMKSWRSGRPRCAPSSSSRPNSKPAAKSWPGNRTLFAQVAFSRSALHVSLCRAKVAKDPELQRFAAEVNGPLMVALAEKAGYHDVDCVELFRTGAPLVGKLTRPLQHSVVCALFCRVCAFALCAGQVTACLAKRRRRRRWTSSAQKGTCVCLHVLVAAFCRRIHIL